MGIIRGMIGLMILILLAFFLSNNKSKINWKLVISGLILQLLIAIFVFKIPAFNIFFNQLGQGMVKFVSFGLDGAAFLFGDLAKNSESDPGVKHNLGFLFAFQALPIVVFFSAISALLYHWGVLQKVVKAFAWLMYKSMKLSGAESLSAAGNIFLGQTEAPLLVRPFIPKMTSSELHCLMTGGMATIAGSVMGAFVGLLGGGDASEQAKFATFFLGASLMSAPAAIVMSKIFYPEMEKVETSLKLEKEKMGVNAIDSLARGALDGLKLALNIGAMLLVFVALIFALNWVLAAFGGWVGLNEYIFQYSNGVYSSLSIEFLLGQLFRLVAFAIGVSWEDSALVGSLIGQKVVINEFVAYYSLADMVQSSVLSDKSIMIATYALCGFANFGSIAIQIGGIGAMAPNRQSEISKFGLRSLLAALMATLMTATIAGMLFE